MGDLRLVTLLCSPTLATSEAERKAASYVRGTHDIPGHFGRRVAHDGVWLAPLPTQHQRPVRNPQDSVFLGRPCDCCRRTLALPDSSACVDCEATF